MKRKCAIGLVLFILGLILIGFSIYGKDRIAAVKSKISMGSQAASHGGMMGKKAAQYANDKASSYDSTVMLVMIGGIVIAVVGAGMMIRYKKK
jgi:hypothetical protein